MGRPVELQSDWSKGMKQDYPRVKMPRGSAWNMVDFIPNLDAPLRKRGGWSYASGNLAATAASATYISSVHHANFISGAKLIAIADSGELLTIASTASATLVGTAVVPVQNPVEHTQKLIIPASNGTTAPKYYDGTTLGNLAGSPPAGKYASVYKDRTQLAGTSANPTYVYFSDGGDPTTWDTTGGWISVSQPVTGLAALPSVLLVFQEDVTSRIRGSIPPPSGSDMVTDDPIFGVGCTDARSIVVTGPYAIFANPIGVFRTNGTSFPEDLTRLSGLSRYWQGLMGSYSRSTWTLSAGFMKNYYIISVMNGSSFVDAFMFDLSTSGYNGFRLSNLKSICFDTATVIGEEMYFGLRGSARVAKASTMFTPGSSYKTDADGTAVTPVLETPMFGGDAKEKTWRGIYVTADLTDAASDNPTIQVSYLKKPEDSYTAITSTNNGVLSETTTDDKRSRVGLLFPSDAVALKFAQSNASGETRLYSIEADVHVREGSRTV